MFLTKDSLSQNMEAIKRKHEVMRALFQPCNHVVFVRLLCSFYLCQGGYVIVGVSLFVSSITQKLLKQLSQNLVERWHVAHGRPF